MLDCIEKSQEPYFPTHLILQNLFTATQEMESFSPSSSAWAGLGTAGLD